MGTAESQPFGFYTTMTNGIRPSSSGHIEANAKSEVSFPRSPGSGRGRENWKVRHRPFGWAAVCPILQSPVASQMPQLKVNREEQDQRKTIPAVEVKRMMLRQVVKASQLAARSAGRL
ncbi:unnamed protein product, partial [Protopolystoma xenopodis]